MIINQNASSAVIKAWQEFLNSQHISVGTADGLWGQHTESGSKTFQSQNSLTADGIVGPATIKAAEANGFHLPQPRPFQPAGNLNAVFDISHLNEQLDLAKAQAADMMAVFHKATQSIGVNLFHDKKYPDRRTDAKDAGLLWGAYHFGTSGSGTDQANAFVDYAQPDKDTLLVLDFERATTKGESSMNLQEARDFVNQVKVRTGKYPGIYGGSMLKEVTKSGPDPVLSHCWLWIAQYAEVPHLPNGWSDYRFWQYTDGVHGPGALPIDGVGNCDRDLFQGTAAELTAFWKGQ